MDPSDIWAALGVAAYRLQRSRSPWQSAQGPCAALLLTCVRLGWQVLTPHQLITQTGLRVNLRTHSAKYVSQLLREATAEWSDRYATKAR
eukprot:6457334-Amphidinium_carterae.1